MHESKRAKITRLETEVQDLKGELTSLGPYIELARSMHARVMGHVAAMDEVDLEQAFTNEMVTLEQQAQNAAIKTRVDGLPDKLVLDWYTKLTGDTRVEELIKARGEFLTRMLSDTLHLDFMFAQAAEHGYVDTSLAKVNDTFELYLKEEFYGEGVLRLRCVREAQPEEHPALYAVLSCDIDDDEDDYYDPHTVVEVGTVLLPDASQIDPTIYLQSPITIWPYYDNQREDEPTVTDGILYQLRINNKRAMPVYDATFKPQS